jgi:DNA replication factor GINS
MDIEEISQTLYKEKNQAIKAIPADFYREADKCVRELEKEIREINNPRSPESKMLNDELEKAYSDLRTIFMNRVGKAITRARNQSEADKPISKDIEKLLPAEKRLYELVLQGIEATKAELLGPLEPILYPNSRKDVSWPQPRGEIGKMPSPLPGDVKQAGAAGTGSSKPGEKKKEASGAARPKNNIKEGYVVVQILKDLPTFTGADGRNYNVSAEDIVMLPQLNATGLIKRKAAKMISGKTTGQAPEQKG